MTQETSSKIIDRFATFDEVETRPGICGLSRWLALLLLGLSFVFDLILVMGFAEPYQVAQFSQDEYWFVEEIVHLQILLLTGDWAGLRAYGSPFAYGFSFWLFTAVISFPLYRHYALLVLFLRTLFMAMKYAALYVAFRGMRALTQKPVFALLFVALLLIVPAFVFDGKIISPEYFIMLLVAIGCFALFKNTSRAQIAAAFCFALAATIKINMAPLGLVFVGVLLAHEKEDRLPLLKNWIFGGILPALLFLFPAEPLKEILAIGSTHHVDWGLRYLPVWYGYDALEFDEMLKGGWSIDFICLPLFLILLGTVIYRHMKGYAKDEKALSANMQTILVWSFYAALLTCFLTSLTSLMHPWFVFAPFLLLMASAGVLAGAGRGATALMLSFLLIYALWFGARDVQRWQHRVDKYEAVAASENADADVAWWIAANCPEAREAAIDYNLLWPTTYNGHLHKMWTLIEIEDYRRLNGDANTLINNIDLLLLKRDRVNAIMPPNSIGSNVSVPGAVLGNFFSPNGGPFFSPVHDFDYLTVFARKDVCKKPEDSAGK